ncbi:glycoside hydrolase family 19 protein [Mesorhizobium sp. WSM1293]|uniref:glycoside hydrolase family 19 protein n=1 Tax=Mesorhizobium sp. WSM1293 TaxID=1040984 RepID=UPI0004B1F3F0|nr:glycoside hydrolase family 19 protein [Mesorhizobium sp. WSM1293]
MLVYPSAADLAPLFPHADPANLGPFLAACPTAGDVLGSVLRLGQFIGQCGVESNYFRTYEEYASGAAYEGREDLGNTQPGDGKRFKGRGPIQLTGRADYREATPFVRTLLGRPDIDLEATPDLVATDRAVGFATSLWYWQKNNLNVYADRNDTAAVSRGVNRGNPKSSKPANAEADRIALTHRVIAALEALQTAEPVQTAQPAPAPAAPQPVAAPVLFPDKPSVMVVVQHGDTVTEQTVLVPAAPAPLNLPAPTVPEPTPSSSKPTVAVGLLAVIGTAIAMRWHELAAWIHSFF